MVKTVEFAAAKRKSTCDIMRTSSCARDVADLDVIRVDVGVETEQ